MDEEGIQSGVKTKLDEISQRSVYWETLRDSHLKLRKITPWDLLIFAKQLLLCIGIIFLMSWPASIMFHMPDIFEGCKVILPPMAFTILGFYFGKN